MGMIFCYISLLVCYFRTFAGAASISPASTISYSPLGDSYASGNGAGQPIQPLCGRYNLAYPVLLAQYFSLTPVSDTFYDATCGGATTWSVQGQQLGHIAESDLVTLTVGGNEVEFFFTLNDCVYHWWEGRGCETQMESTKRTIESTALIESYSNLIKAIVQQLKPEARLLVTGYATFFNEETEPCNSVTFSVKEPYQFLTRELRKDINELVRLLNTVIEGATSANGAQYVDIDEPFTGHRFCEDGVQEPDISRTDTWFYSLNGTSPKLHSEGSGSRFPETFVDNLQKTIGTTSSDFEQFTRVFHPTPDGHTAFADAIFKSWKKRV